MEIAAVVDRESLEVYLEALPKDERRRRSVFVAGRAAARVAPKALRFVAENDAVGKGDLTALPIWGVLTIPQVAFLAPTSGIAAAYAAGAAYVAGAAIDAADAADAAYAAARAAARAAAQAAAYAAAADAAADAAAYAAADAADAAAYAAAAVDAEVIWGAVRHDLSLILGDTLPPLWGSDPMPDDLMADLAAVRAAFEKSDDAKHWRFWLAWYDRVLAGRDIHAKMMAPILNTLTDKDWLGPPANVSPLFDDVLAVYEAEDFVAATPYGYRATLDGQVERLGLVPVAQIDLAEVVKKARAALADFKRRCHGSSKGSNVGLACWDALAPEIEVLRKKLSKHKNDPQGLHYEMVRLTRYFERVLREKDLFDTAASGSLTDDLRGLGDDICLLSEPVRKAEQRRLMLAMDRATSEQLLIAVRACIGMATDGDAQMRAFAAMAMRALADPDASRDEKQMAWFFATRMGAESALLVKGHEAQVGNEKSKFGKRLKDGVDLMVAGDKGIDVVQEALKEGGPVYQQIIDFIASGGGLLG